MKENTTKTATMLTIRFPSVAMKFFNHRIAHMLWEPLTLEGRGQSSDHKQLSSPKLGEYRRLVLGNGIHIQKDVEFLKKSRICYSGIWKKQVGFPFTSECNP